MSRRNVLHGRNGAGGCGSLVSERKESIRRKGDICLAQDGKAGHVLTIVFS